MPVVAIYNVQGQQVGDLQLNESIFAAKISEAAMHQVVINHLANLRRGTHSTKSRGEVSGGGKKPWRQKGTGRARAGTSRSPLWRGGSIIFGPKPRDYSYTLPRKLKRVALRSAFTSKVNDEKLIVLDQLSFDAPKTKEIINILKALDHQDVKTLVIIAEKDDNVTKSIRNIEGVTVINSHNINVYDIVNNEKVIMTKDAVARVEEVLV
ncbi:MAG: 50S ribosomal protein L4 [Desulfitibacter sp. BRH_c19]|nr:MAG: 50S ribosomal protein L4 [Desulfitibacter sp. BRH_c19]